MRVRTINPSTGIVLEEFGLLGQGAIESALALAHAESSVWKTTSVNERCQLLRALGGRLRANREELALLATREMGKTLSEALAEVDKCAHACEHYAEHGPAMLADQVLVSHAPKATVTFQPLGVILGVMPWNFPYWQVIRFAVPTLLAGNCVLIKHAPNTFGCARLLADQFRQAGFASGVYIDFPIAVEDVATVLADHRVSGVSLTGSTRAGRAVAEAAGRNLKKCVLELGGSDPYVVLDDADLDLASEKAVQSRMLNNGQSCIAAKRFIVTEKRKSAFTQKVYERMKSFVPASPELKTTRLGPLARSDLRESLHAQVLASLKQGATLLLGGEIPEGPGFFYPATLLTDLNSDNVAAQEELFGPVAAIFGVANEQDAIRLANQSPYGLGAAVFSQDVDRAEKIARDQLQAGLCFVNDFVRSDPRWPFGGVKDSGFGRELTEFGLREFVNIKTLVC